MNSLCQMCEVVHCQPFRRNQVRKLQRGDKPNTKTDIARTCGQIIVPAREQRFPAAIKLE